MMQRRRFLARAGGTAVLATGVLADAPTVIAQSKVLFQALLGGWDHVAGGAYHQLLKG